MRATEDKNKTDDPTAPELSPEAGAPQITESGKLKRFWLKYIGPQGTSLVDPNTTRTWKSGEEQEVTEEEGERLRQEFPQEVELRSTSRDPEK